MKYQVYYAFFNGRTAKIHYFTESENIVDEVKAVLYDWGGGTAEIVCEQTGETFIVDAD